MAGDVLRGCRSLLIEMRRIGLAAVVMRIMF